MVLAGVIPAGALDVVVLAALVVRWARSLPAGSVRRCSVERMACMLAFLASPDDAAWREEWPALLGCETAWRRPGRLVGFAIAAIRSRSVWCLDRTLASQRPSGLIMFVVTAAATLITWRTAGILQAFVAMVFTYTSVISTIDVLCRRRDIPAPHSKRAND
jgi:hypothetical protein